MMTPSEWCDEKEEKEDDDDDDDEHIPSSPTTE